MSLGEGRSSRILSCFDHSEVSFDVNSHVFKFAPSFSLQDEQFLGFGSDEEVKVQSPARSPTGTFKGQDGMLTLVFSFVTTLLCLSCSFHQIWPTVKTTPVFGVDSLSFGLCQSGLLRNRETESESDIDETSAWNLMRVFWRGNSFNSKDLKLVWVFQYLSVYSLLPVTGTFVFLDTKQVQNSWG